MQSATDSALCALCARKVGLKLRRSFLHENVTGMPFDSTYLLLALEVLNSVTGMPVSPQILPSSHTGIAAPSRSPGYYLRWSQQLYSTTHETTLYASITGWFVSAHTKALTTSSVILTGSALTQWPDGPNPKIAWRRGGFYVRHAIHTYKMEATSSN